MEIVNVRTQSISCQKESVNYPINYPAIWPRSGDVCFQCCFTPSSSKTKTLPKLNIIQALFLLKPSSRMVPILFEPGKITNCHLVTQQKCKLYLIINMRMLQKKPVQDFQCIMVKEWKPSNLHRVRQALACLKVNPSSVLNFTLTTSWKHSHPLRRKDKNQKLQQTDKVYPIIPLTALKQL